MTNLKEILILTYTLLSPFFFASCEQELDLNIPEHNSKLVVEGWIEQDKGAQVLLSLSAPYFTKIDSSNLRDYSVTRAKVSIKSNSGTEVLTLKPNEVFFPPYYYFGTEIVGKSLENYQIEIVYQGEIYIAETSIPKIVPLDSIWFENQPGNDTLGLLGIRLSDNINEKNYYRVLTKRLGKDERFIPAFTSVFSDELFNGQTIDLTLSRGNSSLLEIGSDRFFHVTDTVMIKFCSIDKEHFEFWNTLQSQIISSANPFAATNNKISSNIENGFGIWGGLAAWYGIVYGK